jgi:hypothetical protein
VVVVSAPVAVRSAGRTDPERTRAAARGGGKPPRTATIPAQRAAPAVEQVAARGRRGAAQRAYARRDERVRRLTGAARHRGSAPAGRAQFVLLVMILLGAGLVATLWLSTAAAADSYRLQDARTEARALSEHSERLRREVTSMAAAPALAQRAEALGMVPVQNPARLVVAEDGAVEVVGRPRAVPLPAPPPVPTPGAEVPGGAPAGSADPAAAAPAATDPAAVAPADPAAADPTAADPTAADPAAAGVPAAAGTG